MILSALLLEFCEGVPFYKPLVYTACLIIALIWVYVGSFVRLGYLDYNLALLDRRQVKEGVLFGASTIWWNSVLLYLVMLVRVLIGSIFLLIPGVIIYYNYAMAPFLLEERKSMSVAEALRMSLDLHLPSLSSISRSCRRQSISHFCGQQSSFCHCS